jgi:hypothetical protein
MSRDNKSRLPSLDALQATYTIIGGNCTREERVITMGDKDVSTWRCGTLNNPDLEDWQGDLLKEGSRMVLGCHLKRTIVHMLGFNDK